MAAAYSSYSTHPVRGRAQKHDNQDLKVWQPRPESMANKTIQAWHHQKSISDNGTKRQNHGLRIPPQAKISQTD